jgi:nucleoid-associated protein YgaU
MKQNERWLVYAVTGFLALLLVAALVFRGDADGAAGQKKPLGLDQLLGQNAPGTANSRDGDPARIGVPAPADISQQPLVASVKPLLAADLVLQQLGPSRRDRNVRFVRARQGDSLDLLVQRWCGARDPFLAEAKCLNEDLVVLRVGQEVAVPWVDDEVVLAAHEARQPKTLLASDAVGGGDAPKGGAAVPANARPDFQLPGAQPATAGGGPARAPASTGGTSYTVKSGDSLWRIAERTYGRKHADRMVAAIRDANPGLGENLMVGQKLVLPVDPQQRGGSTGS